MSKRFKHECAYCHERFASITDHMTHVLQSHDKGYRGRGERVLRPVSCWSCTKEMQPRESDGWYSCPCGFEMPRNWVNGQLTDENESKEGGMTQ